MFPVLLSTVVRFWLTALTGERRSSTKLWFHVGRPRRDLSAICEDLRTGGCFTCELFTSMILPFWPRRSWQFYLARLWRQRCRQPQDLLHTVITAVCYKHTGHVCSVWRQRFCNHRANAERTASEQRHYACQF